jgi:cytochrome c oxidase subunit I+III
MATTSTEAQLERIWKEEPGPASFFTTVDHKRIGKRYIVTALIFFVAGGIEALVMRWQLARPGQTVLTPEQYDQLFSMHGTTMIFLFITPLFSGLSNYIVPLQIGARDMAFPRLNAFSYWVYLLAGLFMYASFVYGAVPNGGWFAYPPLTSATFDTGHNMDVWTLGLVFLSIATTAGGVNLIVTILKLRAPGMSLARMPLFVWAVFVTSWMMVLALPPLTLANVFLELDRQLGMHFFDPGGGGDPLLWQHLFWLFGHPDVYIIFLPAVGIVSSVIPTFARRPIVGYTYVALATVLTGIIGFGVWVHHMFATGLPQLGLTFFAAASMIITIPSGIQVFAWVATISLGKPVFRTPFLFAVGFIIVFVIGGVTGVMFASVPFDQGVTDSYFIVAHFHYVLFGGAVFPMFAGVHYWFPKITGRMYDERLGKITFWLVFVGFNLTFFPMHIMGLLGMPRRIYTYSPDMGVSGLNLASSIGAAILAVGVIVFIANMVLSLRIGEPASSDPWGAATLEWATTSPPPEYDFAAIPTVEGREPLWEQPNLASDLVLAERKATLGTTVMDAVPEEEVPMPESSIVPLLLALSLAGVFVSFLAGAPLVAAAFAVLGAAAIGWWAWRLGGVAVAA